MKKVFAIILAVVMMFSLSACNIQALLGEQLGNLLGNLPIGESGLGDLSGLISGIDLGSITGGIGVGDTSKILGEQDETTKQQIVDKAKENGIDITFDDDGTTTIKDPDSNSVIVQNPDGTWVAVSEDGTKTQLGGVWPENEFTKLIPDPGFSILAVNTSDSEFSAILTGATVEDLKEYTEKVKDAGFNRNKSTEDTELMGLTVFTFSAENSDGWTVSVNFAIAASTITVSKP